MKITFYLILIGIFLFTIGCGSPIESGLIYFPSRDVLFTPENVHLEYEDIFMQTKDGVRVHAWYIPCQEATATMLWFHGNAGNIGDRVDHLKVYHNRWKVNQMIVEYRGYGKSEGRVSEEGTYEDGRAAVRYLTSEKGVSPDKLFIFGRSLGSAVAVQMALESPCAGLMLEAPFTSVRDMAKTHYPLLGHIYPLRIRYDSIGKLDRIHVPLLILHGDQDTIVPVEMGKRLFRAANEPKTYFTIRNAGHNDILIRMDKLYHETVQDFIQKCIQDQDQGT